MRKSILITGAGGMLGSEFIALSARKSFDANIVGLSHAELDATCVDAVERAFEKYHPDVVINCAGTGHNWARADHLAAEKINRDAPSILAKQCAKRGGKLIHFSTAYVFDGTKSSPYLESDTPNPINRYGAAKLAGEAAIRETLGPRDFLILRVNWLYGKFGHSFLSQMIAIGKESRTIAVVSDQYGTPMNAAEVAERTLEIAEDFNGVFHLAASGGCTRRDFIQKAFQVLGLACEVTPAKASDFADGVRRPANSVMDTEYGHLRARLQLLNWEDMLRRFLASGIPS